MSNCRVYAIGCRFGDYKDATEVHKDTSVECCDMI